LPTWIAWAGSAASLTLAACTLPSAEWGETREGQRRANAQRHAQLALAYLGRARADVAGVEVASALALAPNAPSVRHAAALVDAAQGHQGAALAHFAAAVAAVDRERELSESARSGASDNAWPVDAVAAGQAGGAASGDARGMTHARTTLADARTLWSNYAQALCAAGRIEEADRFFRRASAIGDVVPAAAGNARPALDEAASQRQCRRAF